MAAPNVHQSKSSEHDRLGFHPDCPTCRQDRLFGVLSPQPAFSYRLRVLLATGVLALSAGAATTSVASEPDHQEEGVSVPGQEGSPAPGDSSGSAEDGQQGTGDELGEEPTGETPLPIEVAPVPSDAPEDSGGGETEEPPLEPQPGEDPDGGAIDVEDPIPPTEAPPPVAPAPPVALPPVAQPEPADGPAATEPEHEGHEGGRRRNEPGTREGQRGAGPAPPAPTPAPVYTPALATPAEVESAPAVESAARFHVVRAGESLWAIAVDLLGPRASIAAIASEVRRLWDVNGARIGTGDPDLLPVGVKLRVR